MSQVYMSIIRPVIVYTVLLESIDLSVFQNLHCDEKSFSMHSNVSIHYSFIFLFTFLFIYLIFVYFFFILFNQEDRFYNFLEHILLNF